MSTPARDQAVDFTIGLCTAVARRLSLRLDDRAAPLAARFVDLIVAAAIERMEQQDEGDDLDALLAGDDRPLLAGDDRPLLGPLQGGQYQIQLPPRRREVER